MISVQSFQYCGNWIKHSNTLRSIFCSLPAWIFTSLFSIYICKNLYLFLDKALEIWNKTMTPSAMTIEHAKLLYNSKLRTQLFLQRGSVKWVKPSKKFTSREELVHLSKILGYFTKNLAMGPIVCHHMHTALKASAMLCRLLALSCIVPNFPFWFQFSNIFCCSHSYQVVKSL
jgi:hypothetical protein